MRYIVRQDESSGEFVPWGLESAISIVQLRQPSFMYPSKTSPQQSLNAIADSAAPLEPNIQYIVRDSASDDRVLPTLLLLLLSIPFEWLRVSWIGHRSVLTIPLMLVVLDIARSPESGLRRLQKFLQLAPWIHGLYFAYLSSLTCAALWGPNFNTGIVELARAWSQFGFYVIVGTYLTEQPAATIARTLLTAIPVAIVGFVAYCFYVFRARGDNLISQLAAAAYSGSSNAVANRVLKNVVNFQFTNSSAAEKLEIAGSVRNGIAAAMLLLLLMSWIYAAAIPRIRRSAWHSLALGFITLGVPILLVILMSRSSLISLALAAVICFVMHQVSYRGKSNNSAATAALLLLLVGGGIGMFMLVHPEENGIVSLNVQRMNEISKDVRIEHYRGVYQAILKRPLLGYGLGAITPDGLAVHNLFLGGWFRAGVAGLLFSVLFYIALLVRWLNGCLWLMTFSGSTRNLPSLILLPALMVEPLSRAPLIGGQDGRYIRVEWLAIACFLTIFESVRSRQYQVADDG